MASDFAQKPPVWFWIVSALFLVWGLLGAFSIYMFVTLGPTMNASPDEWERAYAALIPGWYVWVYVVAVGGGVLGAAALLARSRYAGPLFIASIVGVVIQFGYAFLATDLIAHKGAAATIPFPAFILFMALLQFWFAGMAAKRGWIS
jgi:hypothetical protein